MLGLRFCVRAFSSCGEWGPLFIVVRGPLTIAASPVAEHRLQMRRLSSCGSRAQSLRGMWDLPRPGLEPVSPASAGRLSTTAPPGKPWLLFFDLSNLEIIPFNLAWIGVPRRMRDRALFDSTVDCWNWPLSPALVVVGGNHTNVEPFGMKLFKREAIFKLFSSFHYIVIFA